MNKEEWKTFGKMLSISSRRLHNAIQEAKEREDKLKIKGII